MRDTQLKDFAYDLVDGAGWFNVQNVSIRIVSTDEGVLVDIYPKDGGMISSIASCYAFFDEVENA